MFSEDHPFITLFLGVAGVAVFGIIAAVALNGLDPATANPLLNAGLLAAGLGGTAAGINAVGSGLAGLFNGRAARRIEGDSDDLLSPHAAAPQISITINNPTPQPDGPEPPEIVFADRILAERQADLEDDRAELVMRRLH